MSQETDPLPSGQPTRELLLAQALETCIKAERQVPGSADYIIAHQPAWARTELRRLVALAGSLDAVATSAVMSDEFRVSARARLMERIGGTSSDADGSAVRLLPMPAWLAAVPSSNGHQPRPLRRGSRRWVWRGASGGLLAAVLAITATLTASANALPGEPLYGIKQAQEELGLRLAPDDQTRALALLQQADARLDETARLLQAGRTDQVALTTQRYDEVVDRATTTYVVTIAESASEASATAHMETKLSEQQEHLQALLVTAPEPARPGLREALVATERGRALVADPQPVERALGRARSNAAAALPTMAVETVPTIVKLEPAAPAPETPASPPPAELVADRHDAEDQRARQVEKAQTEDRGEATASTAAVGRQGQAPRVSGATQSDQQRGARPAVSNRGPERVQQLEPAPVAVTRDGEGGDDREGDRTDVPSPGDGRASVPQLMAPVDKRVVAPATTDEDTRGRVADAGDQDNVAREMPSTATSATTARSPQPAVVSQPERSTASGDRGDGGGDDRSTINARNSTSGSNTRSSATTVAPSTTAANTVSATPTPAPVRARTATSSSGSTTTSASTTTTTTTSSSGDHRGGTSGGGDGGKTDGGHGGSDDK